MSAESPQAIFEQNWLEYARKVLAQNCGCPCDKDEIAWPGYIGPNYAKGRVLFVGAIHNAPVLRSSGVYEIVPMVKRWYKNEQTVEGDRTYLDLVWTAYKAAIPKWKRYQNSSGKMVNGTVWINFLKVLKDFGLSLDEIAFTNLAKCGLPTQSSWTLERPRITCHESKTPLMDVIEKVAPRYVLVAKHCQGLDDVVRFEERDGTFMRRCENLNFVSAGVKRKEWSPRDASAYASTTA